MVQKIVYTLIIIIIIALAGSALNPIWTKEINMLKWVLKHSQSFLALLAICAVLFSVMKVFSPGIKLKIVSCYHTVDEKKIGLFILKLQTISNVDLMLDDVMINVTLENGKTLKMVPWAVRWKGVIFKMLDTKKQERDYKLLKPLEPDLRICGIKRGSTECYISMRSAEIFEDKPIKSWSFELKYRHHLLPIPNLPWFNRKTIAVIQPEGKDVYFEDLLFQKISSEERKKLIEEL